MTETILTAEHLSKWYGDVIGLNDVSVEVPKGITGLLGPNGAGKSTFLKLCTGLIRPSRGRIGVLGHVPWNNPRLLTRVGLAPEHDTFYDRMTGLEFVTLMARVGGMRPGRADQAARSALDQVAMTPNINRRVGTYSKGMKQRTKIAQSLVHDPELLFFDEPLTGTDPVGRREMIDFIRGLAKRGKSVVVSTHVLHEVEAMTQNILLIAKGRILAEGNIHQIRELIDEHPHNVRIEVDRPRELAQQILALPHVVNVHFPATNLVEVQTRRPEEFYPRVTELLVRGKYNVTSMSSPDDNLSSVFKYLVG